jgi:1,2-diacylglycerol 3-alpha-glucosyltransferase
MHVVIFHRIGPYHEARIRAAAELAPLVAIQGCSKDATYAWDEINPDLGCPLRTLFADQDSEDFTGMQTYDRLKESVDWSVVTCVFIPGWSGPLAIAAIKLGTERLIPMVIMSESNAWDEPRVAWKEWVKSRLVQMAGQALVGGRGHRDYLTVLGIPPERVALGYDVVDNSYFQARASEARAGAARIREDLQLPKSYFLASGRFIAKKNLVSLLEAFADYRQKASGDLRDLVLLGDGELRQEVAARIAELRLTDCVHLPGFKQYDVLPHYYALADAFVHTSTTEQWGLVVNEAMACGLPVIISNRCGCASELVSPGVNGWTLDPFNVAEIASKLIEFHSLSDSARSAMSEASSEIITAWGPRRFATGLTEAAKLAIGAGPRRAKILDRLILTTLATR